MNLQIPRLSPAVCFLLSLTLLVTGCMPPPNNRVSNEQYLLASRSCSACVPQNTGLNDKSAFSAMPSMNGPLLKFEPIYFDTNQSLLRPIAQSQLDKILAAVRASNPGRVVINGHTDSRADSAYNIGLSMRRANAVKRALINRGVERTLVEVQGHGETQPADSNSNENGRQNNRRVEVMLF
ncbi:MAG: OmpA family protein [Pseudomonadota bacterium]